MAKEIKAKWNTVVPVSAGISDCVLHLIKLCYVQPGAVDHYNDCIKNNSGKLIRAPIMNNSRLL